MLIIGGALILAGTALVATALTRIMRGDPSEYCAWWERPGPLFLCALLCYAVSSLLL